MIYGFTTGLIAKSNDKVDYECVEMIRDAGYDYAEFPLNQIDALTEEEFEELLRRVKDMGLTTPSVNNFFPSYIRLTGPEVGHEKIKAYLEHAVPRAAKMGVRTIIFGSFPSRNTPEGWSWDSAMDQIVEIIKECVLPICGRYGILVVIEPILKELCNFINSLPDGMDVVRRVNDPGFMLLADTMHMIGEHDDPALISEYRDHLRFVHISEKERILPEDGYSEVVQGTIDNLVKIGYDGSITFEALGGNGPESMKKALTLLKSQFNK